MKLRILRPHLADSGEYLKRGRTITAAETHGRSLVRSGLAEEVKEKSNKKAPAPKNKKAPEPLNKATAGASEKID